MNKYSVGVDAKNMINISFEYESMDDHDYIKSIVLKIESILLDRFNPIIIHSTFKPSPQVKETGEPFFNPPQDCCDSDMAKTDNEPTEQQIQDWYDNVQKPFADKLKEPSKNICKKCVAIVCGKNTDNLEHTCNPKDKMQPIDVNGYLNDTYDPKSPEPSEDVYEFYICTTCGAVSNGYFPYHSRLNNHNHGFSFSNENLDNICQGQLEPAVPQSKLDNIFGRSYFSKKFNCWVNLYSIQEISLDTFYQVKKLLDGEK